jgi:hypothetical protein
MTNVKTIIVVGITRIIMKELCPLLLAETNINHVSATRKVESIGRYLITDDTHQEKVMKSINEKLPTWLETIPMDPNQPTDFPEPGITN